MLGERGMSRCSVEVTGKTYALLLVLWHDCGLRLHSCRLEWHRLYLLGRLHWLLSWYLFDGLSRFLCLCLMSLGCSRWDVELFVGLLTREDRVDLQDLFDNLFGGLSVAVPCQCKSGAGGCITDTLALIIQSRSSSPSSLPP